MQLTLSIKNNKYYLVGYYMKNGIKKRKSCNNQIEIIEDVTKLMLQVDFYIKDGKKTVICFKDTTTLTINDSNLLKENDELFVLINSTLSVSRKNVITKKNIAKIATITIAGFLLITPFLQNEALAQKQEDMPNTSISQDVKTTNSKILYINDVNDKQTIANEEETEQIDTVDSNYNKEDLNYESRIQNCINIYDKVIANNQHLPISLNMNEYALNRITKFLNSEAGSYVYQYAQTFGVDPYLLVCIAMKESSLMHSATCPNGEYYNYYAVGLFQHETPDGSVTIKAYNYDINDYETMVVTMENALNLETNIKMAAMRLQGCINHYKGNINLALQGYHWGNGVTDLGLLEYADKIGSTYDEVISNINDTGYISEFRSISETPKLYASNIDRSKYEGTQLTITIDYLANWSLDKYGNYKYIEESISYYLGTISQNKIRTNDQASIVTFDLISGNIYTENLENHLTIK